MYNSPRHQHKFRAVGLTSLTAPAFDASLEIYRPNIGGRHASQAESQTAQRQGQGREGEMIMPVAHTFEETKDGFEVRSESGTIIMICKCGEGSTAFPLGTAQLAKMLGRDGIEVFDPPFPLSDLFSNPNCLTPSDDSFYGWWIHPADYDPVVRMLKEFGAARNRARRLRVGHGGNLRGIVTSRDNGKIRSRQ